MKAVISDRIYLEVLPHQQQKIDKELTYSVPSFKFGDPPLIIKNMAMIKQGLVAIPVGRQDLIPADHEITDKRILKPVDFPEFNLEVVNLKLISQLSLGIFRVYIERFQRYDNCLELSFLTRCIIVVHQLFQEL